MHRSLHPVTSLLPAALLAWATACQPEADATNAPAASSTSGSPTSYPLTDGDEPTTGSDGPGSTSGDGSSTTGATVDATTTPPPICGDGVVEADEGCDDGAANSPYAACTDACRPNVCGDGKVHAGVEGCDEGPLNVDTGYCRADCSLNVCGDGHVFAGVEECDSGKNNGPTYGQCDTACEINRCGDGEVDVPFEDCDAGPLNGAGAPGEDGIAGCDDLCGFSGRRLFVSSQLFTGAMGTRAGADLACQIMAQTAGLPAPNKYRAVLADAQGSPNSLFEGDTSDLPIITPTGLVLAEDYASLMAFGPTQGVVATETGDLLLDARVWTNVGPFGDAYLLDPGHTCDSWTSADLTQDALVGRNAVGPDMLAEWTTGHQWLSFAPMQCYKHNHIYCIEAP